MAKTFRERFIKALEKRGESEVKRNSKCIVYSRAAGGFYYLGRQGSLRVGKNLRNSIPVSDFFKVELLGEI